MTIAQIEENITAIIDNFNKDDFLFELLLAYGFPKATITRHKKGELNQLEQKGEFTIRKKLFFKIATSDVLHDLIDRFKIEFKNSKNPPRFIILTDYETLLGVDTKTDDTLDIKLADLAKYYDFFLPWAGMEKAQIVDENPADVKAATKMAKLYDEIVKENEPKDSQDIHTLNVFLTRLLFCYFAEDSNIFEENQFTNTIKGYTQTDGSDLDSHLERVFEILNTKDRDKDTPHFLKAFPYVNGGLFKNSHLIPRFTTKSRNIMIEIGELDWSAINPDIFGSMIQAVITPEHRGGLGMHYTSVPNILKMIEPLFLDELHGEFEKSKNSRKKLQALHKRLTNLKIFDPACGSGNFLIIAYKELRKLEIKILKLLSGMSDAKQLEFELYPKPKQQSFIFLLSEIKLSQFYGIELDDFAHEVAMLSLWLAEHQMNIEFFKELGQTNPPLPLKDGGNIVHGNATRLDWEEVCPKDDGDEIYILGNPPYLGSRNQNKEQKEDMKYVFLKGYKSLDYISCWFYLGAYYIRNINGKYAFVSTNSITQGEQVSLLWSRVLEDDLELYFAHKSFKWVNNAKDNAGVTVVIIGIQNKSKKYKVLYNNGIRNKVLSISCYLTEGNNKIIASRKKPLSNFPTMNFGNMPADSGKLLFSKEEKNNLVLLDASIEKYFKKIYGAEEFINGKERWCLWFEHKSLVKINENKYLKKIIDELRGIRLKSSRPKLAKIPHLFAQITQNTQYDFIIIPSVSSEKRKYIPIGLLNKENISTNLCLIVSNPKIYLFGVLTSYMHMLWAKSVGGQLETRIRYSKEIVYNTFPFPNINEKQKELLTTHVFKILEEREKHSEKTLAQLYDPDKMPEGLKKAHHELDLAVERCYRSKPFGSDEERLEYLFGLYEEMVEKRK